MKIIEIIAEDNWQAKYKASVISNDPNESPAKVEQFFNFVSQNCAPFLKEIGGIKNINAYTMYHGTFTKLNPAQLLTVKKHRQPIDTPLVTQELIDDWFEQASGSRFRESSVFAIGDPGLAEAYGSLAVLLPVGTFNYAWSPVYEDLTSALEGFLIKNSSKKRSRDYDDDDEDLIYTDNSGMVFSRRDVTNPVLINKFMDKGKFRINSGLKEAIKMSKEIMIDCKQIIIVSDNWLERVSDQ